MRLLNAEACVDDAEPHELCTRQIEMRDCSGDRQTRWRDRIVSPAIPRRGGF